MYIFLSQSSIPILKYVALVLGWLMNGIFEFLVSIGITNIGIALIIFTCIVYLILTPIQYKTQKSSKMMAALNPEIQKIQKKYAGKKDQYSMQKMQEETQALYRQYGVSMTGSCLPLLIQLPLLLSVYQVVLYIPGYINKVRIIFEGLAQKLFYVDGIQTLLTNFISDNSMKVKIGDALSVNNIIDFLYALKPGQWLKFQQIGELAPLQSEMVAVANTSEKVNFFLGINISESPWDAIKSGFTAITGGNATGLLVLGFFIGIAIPVLAWFTQWLNYKLMPQQTQNSEGGMMSSMNTMNTIMPVISAFFCLTLSMGIGIYWIVGGVMRCAQQVFFNRKIGKIDIELLREKALQNQKAQQARISTSKPSSSSSSPSSSGGSVARSAGSVQRKSGSVYTDPHGGKAKSIQGTEKYYTDSSTVHANSITAKANMVRALDDKNSKKSGKNKNNSGKNGKTE
ncbi:MAG: membrane protein insertase YidC [Eubacterium sp.]|nr:membrane protein insertase YidC [Eubacterium sp.]